MPDKRPFAIDLTYEVVSPLFLGSAEIARPELRPASIRGAVRSWYRAMDPQFGEREGRWFGSAAESDDRADGRPSPWRARVRGSTLRTGFRVVRDEYRRYDDGTPPTKTNGVLYTGYTLMDRFNSREGFHASTARDVATFDLRLTFTPHVLSNSADLVDCVWAVLGSHWLLGHLGALGSRARRGWGSVQLLGMQPASGLERHVPEDVHEVVKALAPARTTSVTDWVEDVKSMLDRFGARFDGERVGAAKQTPHLGGRRRIVVMRRPFAEWAGALDHVGADMQRFRRDQHYDRAAVAQHLLTLQRPMQPGEVLARAPVRSAFGLPLTFRFGLTPKRVMELGIDHLRPETIEFQPAESHNGKPLTRYPGPASLRLVRLSDGWHGAIVRLDGAPVGSKDPDEGRAPAAGVKGKVLEGNRSTGNDTPELKAPASKIIDFWLNSLSAMAIEVPK